MSSSARRFVVSPPSYLDPHFLLNPWMAWHEALDPRAVVREWDALCAALEATGAIADTVPADPDATAMAYTRDGFVVLPDGSALVLRNDGPRGTSEPAIVGRWLAERGLKVRWLPDGQHLDGGNVLRCWDGRWLVGLKPGGDRRAAFHLGAVLRQHGVECAGIPLADPAFVHLDLVLADLGGRGWLVYPGGLAEPDLTHPRWRAIFGDRPVVVVERDEAFQLACNVLVVGNVVLGAGLAPPLCRAIEALGFEPRLLALDEFRKGGGGAHCLTRELSYPAEEAA